MSGEFEQRQELIDRFWANEMSKEEEMAFEKMMEEDEGMALDVALSREVDRHLQDRNWANASETIHAVHKEFFKDFSLLPIETTTAKPLTYNRNRWWLWGGLICLLAIGGIVWRADFGGSSPDEILAPIKTPNTLEENPAEENSSSPKKELPEEEEQPLQEKTETLGPPSSPEPKAVKPIAAVNPAHYAPNQTFEDLIRGAVRSNEYKLRVDFPENDHIFSNSPEGVTNVKIQGTLATEDEPINNFGLYIFDNEEGSFIDNNYLVKQDLKFEKGQNNNFVFSYLADVQLPHGLYYFYILDKGALHISYVGKFLVK